MKLRPIHWAALALAALLTLVALNLALAPHPVALLKVVDPAGKPIAGAVIIPDGARPKSSGNVGGGHYMWRPEAGWPTNAPVVTDAQGRARVFYPKYIHERIETGQISFSVDHPDYVPDRRPFVTVNTAPPAGAPWRDWAGWLFERLTFKSKTARTDPVGLQPGLRLEVAVPEAAQTPGSHLFVQISGIHALQTNIWTSPTPGTIVTRRLSAGQKILRAVLLHTNGSASFSPIIEFEAFAGTSGTNLTIPSLQPALAVKGHLDPAVPRPIRNGRVIAHVWPTGAWQPQNQPPQWHAWSPVADDGSFTISPLPSGDLEILALCQGHISTNGPGQFPNLTYPQKHRLESQDLDLVIGMEPTAALDVEVRDDQDRPLPDARVSTSPNVRYGEHSATIVVSDCYNTADFIRNPPTGRRWWWDSPADFQGTSNARGIAHLPNLPTTVKDLHIEHPKYALPIVQTFRGNKGRYAPVNLLPGRTNSATFRLVPKGAESLGHF